MHIPYLVYCDNKTREIGIDRDYNLMFLNETNSCQLLNVGIFHLQGEYGAWSESRFARYSHLLC